MAKYQQILWLMVSFFLWILQNTFFSKNVLCLMKNNLLESIKTISVEMEWCSFFVKWIILSKDTNVDTN